MITNADKYHLVTNTSDEVSVKIENEIFKNSLQENVLKIVIDNRLTFEPQWSIFVKKQDRNSML